jgi:hypothetical protein
VCSLKRTAKKENKNIVMAVAGHSSYFPEDLNASLTVIDTVGFEVIEQISLMCNILLLPLADQAFLHCRKIALTVLPDTESYIIHKQKIMENAALQ